MRWLIVLGLVASCAQDGGVIIEVTPSDPGVDQIRLFLGTGNMTKDAALELPKAATATAELDHVTYWSRDAHNELDTRTIKSGQTARFVLVRSDTDHLGAVIAVGYAKGKVVEVATRFGIELPARKYAEYHLTLQRPATPPVSWGPDLSVDPRDAVCIGVVDPTQQDPFARSFIVTDHDQDCDGLIEGDGRECNPDAWFGQRSANLRELTCLSRQTTPARCYLGGPTCADNKPVDTKTCSPTAYCVPPSVCASCQGDLACAEDITRAPVRPAGYACTVRVVNGELCRDPIVLVTPPVNGIDCTSALIGNPGHPFDDRLVIDGATFRLKLDPKCRVAIEPQGQPPSNAQGPLGMMVAVGLDNGRGVAVPVVLTLDGSTTSCENSEVKCTPDANLGGAELLACAASWNPPMPAPGLPAGAHDPTLTSDMLQIWFTTDDKTILHSSRPSITASWGSPVEVMQLGTDMSHTVAPQVSGDGLHMLLGSDRLDAGGITGYDLFTTRRADPAQPWPTPQRIVELASTRDETSGSRNADETVMVFAADRDGPTSDLYQTSRTGNDVWSTPTRLDLSTSTLSELDPFLSKDGETLYYTAAGPSSATLGAELLVARRASVADAFATPQRMAELSSPQDDKDPWVSDDGRTIFFTSNRLGGVDRIFFSTR